MNKPRTMIKHAFLQTLLLLAATLLSGCISVEMPKHMISDTVDAGNKAYDGIAGNKTEPANGFEFSYTMIFESATSIKDATEQCYSRLSQHARNELKKDNLVITRQNETIKKHKDLYSIECQLVAADAK